MKWYHRNQDEEEQHIDVSASSSLDIITFRKRMRWIIFPDNRFIIKWDGLMLILILFAMITIPYQVGVSGGYYLVTSREWFVINVFIDLAFFMDTFLYFCRSYRDENGCFVINHKEIRRTYLRSSFLPNLMASLFPSVIFKVAVEFSQSRIYMEDNSSDSKLFFLFISLLKFFRFPQAKKVFFSTRTTRFFLESKFMNPFLLEMIKFILLLFIMSHWIACLWCFIAFYESGSFLKNLIQSENWIAAWYNETAKKSSLSMETVYMPLNPVGWENDMDRYILSLFWSTQTITSIGYGNILPYTILECIFSCLVMLFAGIFWAVMIGSLISVINSMSEKDEARARLYEMNKITRFFHKGNDSDGLIESVERRVKQFVLDQKERRHNFASCSLEICEEFKVYDALSLDLKRMSSYMIFSMFLNAVPYLSSVHLNVEEQSRLLTICQLRCFAAGETFSLEHSDKDDKRGIVVIIEGFGFLKRENDNTTNYMKTGSAHGYAQVLVESTANLQKEEIFFPVYARVLFISRSRVLEMIEKHPHLWKNCARWKYLECLLLDSRRCSRKKKRISNFFFEKY